MAAPQRRLREIHADCAAAWQPGRHDTTAGGTTEDHIAKMREWIGNGNEPSSLPLLLDLRDMWGFPVADEYEELLLAEAHRERD